MYWFWMCFWYLWIFVFSISCLNYYAKVSFGFLLIQFYFNLKWVCLLIVLYICLCCWNVDCPQCWLQKLIFVCQITFQKLENHGILSALWIYFFQHLLNICLCQKQNIRIRLFYEIYILVAQSGWASMLFLWHWLLYLSKLFWYQQLFLKLQNLKRKLITILHLRNDGKEITGEGKAPTI